MRDQLIDGECYNSCHLVSSVWQVLSEGFPLLTSFHSHSQPRLDSVMHIFTNESAEAQGDKARSRCY